MTRRQRLSQLAGAAALVALASACSGSSGYGATPHRPSASPSVPPGSAFSVRDVAGLGPVLVDGRGRTVYLLTDAQHHNVACEDGNGCTTEWPDLPLPDGASGARAGSGVQAALLGTKKSSDGETYPTYHGWLMYEYAGDSSSGQARGEGIRSFGGTWYAISAAGDPVMPGSTPKSSSSSGGYYP